MVSAPRSGYLYPGEDSSAVRLIPPPCQGPFLPLGGEGDGPSLWHHLLKGQAPQRNCTLQGRNVPSQPAWLRLPQERRTWPSSPWPKFSSVERRGSYSCRLPVETEEEKEKKETRSHSNVHSENVIINRKEVNFKKKTCQTIFRRSGPWHPPPTPRARKCQPVHAHSDTRFNQSSQGQSPRGVKGYVSHCGFNFNPYFLQ